MEIELPAGWQKLNPKKTRAYPANEVFDLHAALERISARRWDITVAAEPKRAIAWIVSGVAGDQLDELVDWCGVRIESETPGKDHVAYAGDSYATMDWGFGENELRCYRDAGVFVFVAATTRDSVQALLDRVKVPKKAPKAKRGKPVTLEGCIAAAPDPPPGWRADLGVQTRALQRLAASTRDCDWKIELELKRSGKTIHLWLACLRGEREPFWMMSLDHDPPSCQRLSEVVDQLRKLAGAKVVEGSVSVSLKQPRVDPAAFAALATAAIAEMLAKPPRS